MLAAKHNVIYLEDKPPKVVKDQNSKRTKRSTRKSIKNKAVSKTRKSVTILKTAQLQRSIEVKNECNLNDDDEHVEMKKIYPNDPLFTPQIEFKCEPSLEIIESNAEDEEEADMCLDEKVDKDYCVEQYEKNDEEEYEFKDKWEMHDSYSEDEEDEDDEKFDDDDDDDDEPLILLTQTSSSKTYKKKQNIPHLYTCIKTCKHKCTTKYNMRQRIDIFDYYSHLSIEEKVNFIRKHIRKAVIQRIRNKKRRDNCCYFLKYYNIGQTPTTKQPEQTDTDNPNNNSNNDDDSDDLIKVCYKFFIGTLGITSTEINKATEGYELKSERIVLPVRCNSNEEKSNLAQKSPKEAQKPRLFLDPETGALSNTKPKKYSKRYKRGEPQPEHFPKPINCAIRCIFKCHENFSEKERKQICDSFWSLDFKRRNDFILARIETTDVKAPITPEFRKTDRPTRAYHTKFYFRSGIKSENKRVCKHFLLNTLAINRWFIENAIEFADKTTGSYTGPDMRGSQSHHNRLPKERILAVKDNINSYPCWLPNKNSKTKYLHYNLSIKKMYTAYKEKCLAEQQKYASAKIYYRVFHEEFRLLFLRNPHPKKGGGFLLANTHVSRYTGEEVGGYWIDSEGKQLDIRLKNPAQSLNICQYSVDRSSVPNTSTSGTSANVIDPKLVVNPSPSINVATSYLNPALFENFSQASDNM